MLTYKVVALALCLTGFCGAQAKEPTRSTHTEDFCFQLPKLLGGDVAKLRVTFDTIKYDDVSIAAGVRELQLLRGNIFKTARVTEARASVESLHWARIMLDDGIVTKEGMVEAVEFVSSTRVLGDSGYAQEMNGLARERTKVHPRRPVLAVPKGERGHRLDAHIVAPHIACPKGF